MCYDENVGNNMEKKKFKIQFGKLSIFLALLFIALLGLDLFTKKLVVEATANGNPWVCEIIPDFIYINGYSLNDGAAFSFLSGMAGGRIFLIVITIVMIVIMLGIFLCMPERFVMLKLAIIMIVAGALGNLVDRIALGVVRDFIWMNFFFTRACCNLADFWIVIGTILAAVDVLFVADFCLFPLRKSVREKQKAAKLAEKNKQEDKQTSSTVNASNGATAENKEKNSPDTQADFHTQSDGKEQTSQNGQGSQNVQPTQSNDVTGDGDRL